MKRRAAILLALATSLLVQQLPMGSMSPQKRPSCCLLSEFCPMSARPAKGAEPAMDADCDMGSKNRGAACIIKARCDMGHDGALPGGRRALVAVLDDQVGALDPSGSPELAEGRPGAALTRDARPPTPPPRPVLA